MKFKTRVLLCGFLFFVPVFLLHAQKNNEIVVPIPVKMFSEIKPDTGIIIPDEPIHGAVISVQLSSDQYLKTFEIIAPRTRPHDCKDRLTKPCYFVYTSNEAAYAQNSLASVLENETALTLKSYGIGSVTLSARGTASSQNTVVWNGINLQNAMSGVVDLSTISMNTVQRATVSYGGSSATNGSGAIGSVISLENDLPIENGVTGKINLGVGSFSDKRESVQLNYVTPKFATGFSAMYKSAENNFLFRNTSEIGGPLQNLVNAEENALQILHQTRINFTPQQTLNTYIWYTHVDRQLPPTMVENNTHQFQRDENLRALADWSNKFKNNTLNIKAAYTDEFLTYNSDIVSDSRNRATTTLIELKDVIDLKTGYHVGTGRDLSLHGIPSLLNFGANFSNTAIHSNNYQDVKQRTRVAAFAGYTLNLNILNITTQIREELTDGKFTPFIYSLDAKYNLIQSKKNNLRLLGAYSHNYNVPPLNELYWHDQNYGNPNLLPEESWNSELGLEYQYKREAFSFLARSTAFYIKMRNRIQAQSQNGQFHPVNIPEVNSKGVESFAALNYLNNNFLARIEISHTYTHAVNNDNHLLIYIPEHAANASFYIRTNGYFFRYTQIFSGRRYMTTDESYWTNPYTIGNIVLGFDKKLKKYSFNTQIHIKNVFDVDYQVISYYPMPKRTLQFQVGFGF